MLEKKVFFFIVMALNGQPSTTEFRVQVEDLAACRQEEMIFQANPSHQMLVKGGELMTACIVEYPPSEEH